jgi:hypothetical protein
MPDNGPPALADAEWELPLTEDFVDRVRVGVRRRRLRRRVLAGGSAVATAAMLVLIGIALARQVNGPPTAAPSPVASSIPAAGPSLDGFVLHYLPPGATPVGGDSYYTAPVGPQGLVNQGSAPAPGGPSASVTMRRFTSTDISDIFVSVLRPSPTNPSGTSPAQVTTWLTDGAVRNGDRTDSFDVPAGPAVLLDNVGNQGTTHTLVITATEGAVIVVEGAGSLSADELRRIAAGVAPG